MSAQNLTGLMCGHEFCRNCWTQYLTVKIMDEGMGQVTASSCAYVLFSCLYCVSHRVTTCLQNLEMSGNLTAVREMSGILLKVREMSGKNLVRES